MEGGNSSDSGSGDIIDVTNMSSSFNALSFHSSDACPSDEEKKHAGPLSKPTCPLSVEKLWFTDTSTGVWLLEGEVSECEVPAEYLDVSLESVEEQDNGAGQSEDEGRAEEKGSSDAEGADLPKLCGWVPSQCCLIPLPESPVAGDGEREEGEREEKGCELSESELQRQHERELEVLFGYKPPPTGSKDPSSTEQPGEDWSAEREGDVSVDKEQALVAAHSGKRSNSTDSGVASISPHSSEGDLEQRPSQHRTDTATRQPNEGEQAGDGCVDSTRGKMKSGVEMNSNPKRPSEQLHLPVSRLKTPSEKLRKCSVFTGSPVICSELEDMKEASKMTTLPFPPPTSSSALNTLVLDSGHHTFTLTPPTSHITTLTQHTSPQGEDVLENVSVTDTSTSAGSHERVNGFGKKTKLIRRGTFAYKAGTGAPQVKVSKKLPSKLKSLLPTSGQSALPSQIKVPHDAKTVQQRSKEAQLTLGGRPSGRVSTAVRPSGLKHPGQKIVRKMSEAAPDSAPTISKMFAKPALPKEEPGSLNPARPASSSTGGTQTQNITAGTNGLNPHRLLTPTRMRGNAKQLNVARSKRPTISTTACTVQGRNRTTQGIMKPNAANFNTSIVNVSTCSPSVQQSTPMKQVSHANAAVAREATVAKAANRTVTKDGSTVTRNDPTPITPRSLVGSTPSRRMRPKFSLSSIDSESASIRRPPTTAGTTFTKDKGDPNRSSIESTPISPRKKRRSFIPTPRRQENRGIIPLVYSTDAKSTNPPQQDATFSKRLLKDNDTGASPALGGGRKVRVPQPRARRPLVVRNTLASGLGRKQVPKGQDGPIKPVNTYKYSYRGFGEDAESPVPAAKVVHSPVDKDKEASPHSAWSPIRRKPLARDDACFQCTKRGFRNNSD